MSKILKVKVGREMTPGKGTHYVYPPEYDPQKIEVLCYESVGEEKKVKDRGNRGYEYLIGVVKNEDSVGFLKSRDIIEVDENKASVLGRVWRPHVERITDTNRVLLILSKVARNEPLTEEDRKSIDPEESTPGIVKSKIFDELLRNELQKDSN